MKALSLDTVEEAFTCRGERELLNLTLHPQIICPREIFFFSRFKGGLRSFSLSGNIIFHFVNWFSSFSYRAEFIVHPVELFSCFANNANYHHHRHIVKTVFLDWRENPSFFKARAPFSFIALLKCSNINAAHHCFISFLLLQAFLSHQNPVLSVLFFLTKDANL